MWHVGSTNIVRAMQCQRVPVPVKSSKAQVATIRRQHSSAMHTRSAPPMQPVRPRPRPHTAKQLQVSRVHNVLGESQSARVRAYRPAPAQSPCPVQCQAKATSDSSRRVELCRQARSRSSKRDTRRNSTAVRAYSRTRSCRGNAPPPAARTTDCLVDDV